MHDKELMEKCDELITDFCQNGKNAKLWTMHIPAQEDKDPDLVFSQLLKRFEELLEFKKDNQHWQWRAQNCLAMESTKL
jgi:hypothetical protein